MVLVGAGLLVFGVAALFFLLKPGSASSAGETDLSVVPAAVNFPAPALSLSDLDGRAVSLDDYRGQVVLVNNWATWCPPCRAEMPVLQAFFEDHRRQDFMLVGIEAGEPAAEVARFAEQYGLSFPVWLDPANAALDAFSNSNLPSSYVIDRTGTVVLAWTGPISRKQLENHITPLLKD